MPDQYNGIASPVSILLDEIENEAREVLLLSYTLNLAFWERFALGAARGLGAHVTTVSDAHMTSADIDRVRYAGITYLDGRAACIQGGAFHPKLLVIAGDERSTVALGSGNATIPGWHDNAEIWTVLHGSAHGSSRTFAEIASWLQRLPEMVNFSTGVERALEQTSMLLSNLPNNGEGPAVLTSLDTPILEQLPEGPVEELIVASPFHDRNEVALKELDARLKPKRMKVLVQPHKSIFDGAALVGAIDERGEVASIASERYHHGKLYEWTAQGNRYALTGSPNLSNAALRLSMSDGGNCELALLDELELSLAPSVGGSLGTEIISHSYRFTEESSFSIVILGATLLEAGVEIELHRPLPEPGIIEIASDGIWKALGEFPVGAKFKTIALPMSGGSALRISTGDNFSNTVFVLDPSRALRVCISHKGRVLTNEEEVFSDASIADGFLKDVMELRPYLTKDKRAVRTGQSDNSNRSDEGSDKKRLTFQSWEEYLDECSSRVGHRLVDFALGLPRLQDRASLGDTDYSSIELEDETDNEPTERSESTSLPKLRDLSTQKRNRYQRWCEQLAEISPTLAPTGRLLALRLILLAGAGGLWEDRNEWVRLIGSATNALALPSEVFDEEKVSLASLAAVSLAAIRGEIGSLAVWSPEKKIFEQTTKNLLGLLTDVDIEVVTRYVQELVPAVGSHLEPEMVIALRDSLMTEDTIDKAISIGTQEFKVSVERQGSLIRIVNTQSGNPRWKLLHIIGLAETEPIIGGCALAADGIETLVIWRRPDLVIMRKKASHDSSGRWFVLDEHDLPSMLANGEEIRGERAWWPMGQAAPFQVQEIIKQLGV